MPTLHVKAIAAAAGLLARPLLAAECSKPFAAGCLNPAHFLDEGGAAVGLFQREVKVGSRRAADTAGGTMTLQAKELQEEVQEMLRQSPQSNTSTSKKKTEATGVTMNASGDLTTFMSSTMTNVIAFAVMMLMFSKLRVHYPLMYSNNVLKGLSPCTMDVGKHFTWIRAATQSTLQENIESVGLDNAMLLRFAELAMKICAVVGLPILIVEGPTNYLFGENLEGTDHLSYFSMGAVRTESQLYWFHAGVVWIQVVAVVHLLWMAQREFVGIRCLWLRRMPALRSNTVLVTNIPESHQSDAKLQEFFEVIFPGGKVKSAYCVKDTLALNKLLLSLEDAKTSQHEAQVMAAQGGQESWLKAMLFRRQPAEYYSQVIAELEPKIRELRKQINGSSTQPGYAGFNCASGFVTFHERSDAEVALRLDYISRDSLEWNLESPPCPSDILWPDLMQDPRAELGRTVLGYACIVGLFFAYMPLVVGITNIAKLIDMGPMQPLWAGIAPTLGLTFMVSFLPSFLTWIGELFFTMKAEAWCQHRVQGWYFWFQMFFVVMATAVGQNVPGFTRALVEDPLSVFGILADTMPYATHFYMNYMVLQWVTHATNILRYMNVIKYKIWSFVYDEEQAAQKAEPEAQDYYGIGSRSARWTANLVVVLVFGTLCPWIYLLGLVNFTISRIIYGYLILFAETKKPDLGGVFWAMQLRHVFHGLMVYSILMTGVLFRRSANLGPCIVVAPAMLYVYLSLQRWESGLLWEKLPFDELMSEKGAALEKPDDKLVGQYLQDELMES